VSALSFSPDGHTLAVASDKEYAGGGVALWDYSQLKAVRADPVAYACAVTGRGLNAEEWTRYVPELPYRRTCGG
jgi:WD40 repeat protein